MAKKVILTANKQLDSIPEGYTTITIPWGDTEGNIYIYMDPEKTSQEVYVGSDENLNPTQRSKDLVFRTNPVEASINQISRATLHLTQAESVFEYKLELYDMETDTLYDPATLFSQVSAAGINKSVNVYYSFYRNGSLVSRHPIDASSQIASGALTINPISFGSLDYYKSGLVFGVNSRGTEVGEERSENFTLSFDPTKDTTGESFPSDQVLSLEVPVTQEANKIEYYDKFDGGLYANNNAYSPIYYLPYTAGNDTSDYVDFVVTYLANYTSGSTEYLEGIAGEEIEIENSNSDFVIDNSKNHDIGYWSTENSSMDTAKSTQIIIKVKQPEGSEHEDQSITLNTLYQAPNDGLVKAKWDEEIGLFGGTQDAGYSEQTVIPPPTLKDIVVTNIPNSLGGSYSYSEDGNTLTYNFTGRLSFTTLYLPLIFNVDESQNIKLQITISGYDVSKEVFAQNMKYRINKQDGKGFVTYSPSDLFGEGNIDGTLQDTIVMAYAIQFMFNLNELTMEGVTITVQKLEN